MNKPAANMVWDQRVAGSNPATPTNEINDLAKPPDVECTETCTTTSENQGAIEWLKQRLLHQRSAITGLHRKVADKDIELKKAEQTVRNLERELGRINRQLAEARSSPTYRG
jgi:uncharacterized coiled-coil protein SlyX